MTQSCVYLWGFGGIMGDLGCVGLLCQVTALAGCLRMQAFMSEVDTCFFLGDGGSTLHR